MENGTNSSVLEDEGRLVSGRIIMTGSLFETRRHRRAESTLFSNWKQDQDMLFGTGRAESAFFGNCKHRIRICCSVGTRRYRSRTCCSSAVFWTRSAVMKEWGRKAGPAAANSVTITETYNAAITSRDLLNLIVSIQQ